MNRRPETGDAVRDRGKYIFIWRKTEEAWSIESNIWSSDLPAMVPIGEVGRFRGSGFGVRRSAFEVRGSWFARLAELRTNNAEPERRTRIAELRPRTQNDEPRTTNYEPRIARITTSAQQPVQLLPDGQAGEQAEEQAGPHQSPRRDTIAP